MNEQVIEKPLLIKDDVASNLLSDNSGIKKGMEVFELKIWSCNEETLSITVLIRKIIITSFGKKRGTAHIKNENLEYALCPKYSILALTLEDAKKMAEEIGLRQSKKDIESKKTLHKHWLAKYENISNPQIVANARKKLKNANEASPQYFIKWDI